MKAMTVGVSGAYRLVSGTLGRVVRNAGPMVSIVSIEGNVGCGKSTLLHHLSSAMRGMIIVPEPVNGWTQHLRGVYGDDAPENWKLPMQTLSACTRAESLLTALHAVRGGEGTTIVVERSERSAMIFGSLTLNDDERRAFELLSDRYARIFDTVCGDQVTRKSVYLRASPETCARRVLARSRSGEEGIGADFLNGLHGAHEDAFAETADLVVDCEHASSDSVADRVLRFIRGLRS